MKRVTRNQMKTWLAPMRRCLAELRTGEVEAVRGYAVTRDDRDNSYARIDHCLAGFRALIARLCKSIDCHPIEKIEKKLAAGVPLTIAEIDGAFSLLKECESELIKRTVAELQAARLTEEIVIEFDAMKEAA